jgi:aldehyde dehydrogenase (NAD+)
MLVKPSTFGSAKLIAMSNVPVLGSLIGGEFLIAGGDLTETYNPSDPRDVIAQIPEGGSDQIDQAVLAANAAHNGWRKLTGPARADHLMRWADAIAARAEELAQAVCREVGKPIGEARGEVGRCGMILRYFAGECVRPAGDVIPAQAPGALQFTVHEPLGVVGLITPWNFPLAIPLWKAAPALAFGNTVVLKPAEVSSWTTSLLAETALAANLPAGAFNVVLGHGSTVGRVLCRHEDVRAISFTGSASVGETVALTAAGRNVKYQTEMGGKNVGIVLADADLELAAGLVAAGAMRYAGQKCTATSRAVVIRSQMDAFLAALRRHIEALPLGPVTDPKSAVGPVITREAQARVQGAIESAGLEPAWKSSVPDDLSPGCYVAPTVFRDVDPTADLAQNEIFGPVLAVLAADDLDHALQIANDVPFGLSASLFTKDVASALTYVECIQAGMVRVNGDTTGVDPHAPFGGVKGSSSGSREQGPAARDFYTEVKTVQINPG